MDRADLLFLSQVAASPLPAPDHPQYGLILAAKANAEIERRALRERAEASLYVFCRDILGYGDLYEPLHRPLCEFVQQPTKQLLLLPRGHFWGSPGLKEGRGLRVGDPSHAQALPRPLPPRVPTSDGGPRQGRARP